MLPTSHSLRGSNKLRARKAKLFIETLEERQLLSASPAYPIAPSDILIQLKAGAPTPLGSQVLAGTTVGPEIALVPGLHEVTLAPGVSVAQALTAYRNNPAVQEAESDAVVHESAVPNDAYYQEDQWALNNTGQTGGTYGDSIQAEAAWNVTTGSKNVIVATLDSGVDFTDTDLAANIWTNPNIDPATDDIHGWNFVSNNNNVMDDFWHGTHVAGIIGAVGNNGVGVTGVNWNVQIMALKMLDSSGNGTTANAVLALDYAVEHGAKIVNISWNGGAYSQAFHDAIQNAGNLGVLVVCAAGNNNANDDATTNYPPSYNLPNMIVVAATDDNDNMATFSSYGANTVDIAAPGVNILSTVPGNNYEFADGTSMATPMVSGGAALLLAADPSLTVAQLKPRILGGADYIGNIGDNASKPTATNGILDLANSIAPDLTWNSLSSPATIQPGQSFNLTGSYHDSGSAAGNFTISYYLSTDNVFGDADDVLLGSQGIGGAQVGSFNITSPNFTISQAGSFTIFAKLNSSNTVDEFSGTNDVSNGVAIQTTTTTSTSPAFSINNVTVQEGNSGTTNAVFTVTLSSPLTASATVKYATVNGTATAGSDYTATSGTLTFSAGQTSKTITVAIRGDTLAEPNETFTVQLNSPTKAVLGTATGVGTILSDDGATPALSIGDTSVVNVTRGTTNATFTVSLSSALSTPVTVNFATVDGTAIAGTDYKSTSGQITFNPGQTSQTITVAVIGTTLSELAKTFQVTLTNPINATLSQSQAVGTINNTNLIASNSAGYKAVVASYDPTVLTTSTPGVTTLINGGTGVDTKYSLGSNTFNFYGTKYSTIFVSSSGLVTFGTANNATSNTNLSSGLTQAAIAPLWDDWTSTNGFPMVLALVQSTGGGSRLILEWNNIQCAGGSPWTQTFQVDLQLNTGSTPGDIGFNYYFLDSQDSHAHGATATVGIKNSGTSGSNPLLVSFNNANNPYLTSYSGIRITTSNPFAASSSSASSIGASFLSSSLDGYNQPVTVHGQVSQPVVDAMDATVYNGLSQQVVQNSTPKQKHNQVTNPVPSGFLAHSQSSTASAAPQAGAEVTKPVEKQQIFDDLFAHEQMGEHHLPFRAAGNRLVASDAWIYDNSGFQAYDGVKWNEKGI